MYPNFNDQVARNIIVMFNKQEKYKELVKQAKSLLDPTVDYIANMANLCNLIMNTIPNHWIGFYRVVSDELLLGPYQGPIACTRISYDKGVCGAAWAQKKTIIVDDVHTYPGHIACSALSNSEIVVPCIREGKVFAVLDIDSVQFDTFDETDAKYLEELVRFL